MEEAEDTMPSGTQNKTSANNSCSKYPITGARFNDNIFTLKVGSAQHVFKVHKDILTMSPVLACMTTSSFSEGVSKQITLPEDDADHFGRIIEHLYGNNDAAFDVNLLDLDGAEKLADMYGLAEKYQLPAFQDLIIRKLKQLDLLKENHMAFFRIVRQISQLTRESDNIFMRYFVDQAAAHMVAMSVKDYMDLSELAYAGGHFARIICKIQAALYQHASTNNDKISLKRAFAVTAERAKVSQGRA